MNIVLEARSSTRDAGISRIGLIVILLAILVVASSATVALVLSLSPSIDSSTSTVTSSTTKQVSGSYSNLSSVTEAENFLVDEYNSNIGLLPEYAGAANYWLYSDNYLAIQAFKVGNSSNLIRQQQVEQDVSETFQRYIAKIPNVKNQYMVLTQPLFYFNSSKDFRGYFASEGENISVTLNNQSGTLNPSSYGDIAFLEAIYYHDVGNETHADSLFQIGASMYDGIGIKDSVWNVQYQTFKLALYLYASKLLGESIPSSVQTNLLKMQGTNGGFYTGYNSALSNVGTFENTETTSLSILALT